MRDGRSWRTIGSTGRPMTLFSDPAFDDVQRAAFVRALWLEEGLSASDDPDAEADFRRYAAGYAQTLELLRSLDARLRPLDELLPQPLTLARVWDEVVPVLSEYQEAREAAFTDGPATDWWRERHEALAERIVGNVAAEDIVDRCIECGFCEPLCPSHRLTLSPRALSNSLT